MCIDIVPKERALVGLNSPVVVQMPCGLRTSANCRPSHVRRIISKTPKKTRVDPGSKKGVVVFHSLHKQDEVLQKTGSASAHSDCTSVPSDIRQRRAIDTLIRPCTGHTHTDPRLATNSQTLDPS